MLVRQDTNFSKDATLQRPTSTNAELSQASDADYFIHMDSDCVFIRPVTRSDFVDDSGRVRVKRILFKDLASNFNAWQNVTQAMMREEVRYETMTGFPFTFPRSTYQGLIEHVQTVHGKPLLDVLRSTGVGEFTPLGQYLTTRQPGLWVEDAFKSDGVVQRHSWSGLTPEIAAEFERYIRKGEIKVQRDSSP